MSQEAKRRSESPKMSQVCPSCPPELHLVPITDCEFFYNKKRKKKKRKKKGEKRKKEMTRQRLELWTSSVLRTRDNQLHHPAP